MAAGRGRVVLLFFIWGFGVCRRCRGCKGTDTHTLLSVSPFRHASTHTRTPHTCNNRSVVESIPLVRGTTSRGGGGDAGAGGGGGGSVEEERCVL